MPGDPCEPPAFFQTKQPETFLFLRFFVRPGPSQPATHPRALHGHGLWPSVLAKEKSPSFCSFTTAIIDRLAPGRPLVSWRSVEQLIECRAFVCVLKFLFPNHPRGFLTVCGRQLTVLVPDSPLVSYDLNPVCFWAPLVPFRLFLWRSLSTIPEKACELAALAAGAVDINFRYVSVFRLSAPQ